MAGTRLQAVASVARPELPLSALDDNPGVVYVGPGEDRAQPDQKGADGLREHPHATSAG